MAAIQPTDISSPYQTAVEFSPTYNALPKMGLTRLFAWLRYKTAGLWGNTQEKAQALYNKMNTSLLTATDAERPVIVQKYAYALAAGTKALSEDYIKKFSDAASLGSGGIHRIAYQILTGTLPRADIGSPQKQPTPIPQPLPQPVTNIVPSSTPQPSPVVKIDVPPVLPPKPTPPIPEPHVQPVKSVVQPKTPSQIVVTPPPLPAVKKEVPLVLPPKPTTTIPGHPVQPMQAVVSQSATEVHSPTESVQPEKPVSKLLVVPQRAHRLAGREPPTRKHRPPADVVPSTKTNIQPPVNVVSSEELDVQTQQPAVLEPPPRKPIGRGGIGALGDAAMKIKLKKPAAPGTGVPVTTSKTLSSADDFVKALETENPNYADIAKQLAKQPEFIKQQVRTKLKASSKLKTLEEELAKLKPPR